MLNTAQSTCAAGHDPPEDIRYIWTLNIVGSNGWKRQDILALLDLMKSGTLKPVPHSPRFPPDAYLLVIERQRRPGEIDRFRWFCPSCDELLHEESAEVHDYRADPVSKAYARFFDNEAHRTCKACGHVMPRA